MGNLGERHDANGFVALVRAQLTYPDQKTVTYDYDPVGRLQQVLDWNARPTQYSYYANGQAHTVERSNDVTTTYIYDPWDDWKC